MVNLTVYALFSWMKKMTCCFNFVKSWQVAISQDITRIDNN